jgi:protein tyrosine phosphatase (PTP) superfamily phosphohydrolase (DUF442 family)
MTSAPAMLTRPSRWFGGTECRAQRSLSVAAPAPAWRSRAFLDYWIVDHAVLRSFWTNCFEIAPGVYRSNQPTHARLRRYRDRGIRTIVNLRGATSDAPCAYERESCAALGLTLVDAKLRARQAVPAARILEVLEAMRRAERPVLFHCKSGADRAGFAAAIYLMVFEGVPVAEARRQLVPRYLHLGQTRAGILDYTLDVYEARSTRGAIGFEDWIAQDYDPAAIRAGFAARRPAHELA